MPMLITLLCLTRSAETHDHVSESEFSILTATSIGQSYAPNKEIVEYLSNVHKVLIFNSLNKTNSQVILLNDEISSYMHLKAKITGNKIPNSRCLCGHSRDECNSKFEIRQSERILRINRLYCGLNICLKELSSLEGKYKRFRIMIEENISKLEETGFFCLDLEETQKLLKQIGDEISNDSVTHLDFDLSANLKNICQKNNSFATFPNDPKETCVFSRIPQKNNPEKMCNFPESLIDEVEETVEIRNIPQKNNTEQNCNNTEQICNPLKGSTDEFKETCKLNFFSQKNNFEEKCNPPESSVDEIEETGKIKGLVSKEVDSNLQEHLKNEKDLASSSEQLQNETNPTCKPSYLTVKEEQEYSYDDFEVINQSSEICTKNPEVNINEKLVAGFKDILNVSNDMILYLEKQEEINSNEREKKKERERKNEEDLLKL